MTLTEYLDFRAHEGVLHLRTVLDVEQLRMVRETVRHQLVTDPAMVEMLAALTGLPPDSIERA